MSTLGDYLAYLALRLAWAAGRIIGPVLLRRVLEALGRVASRVDWRRRDVVADNLRNAFPEWSELRIASTATRTYANWGRIAAEVVNADTVVDEAAISRIEPLFQAVDNLAAEGRGVLLLTAHTGNFELLCRMCGLGGKRVAAFNKRMHNRFIARFLAAQRAAAGVDELNDIFETRRALRELRRGLLVAVPLDQNQSPGRGVFVEMFGRKAATSPVLAKLSLSTGAPVLPVFAVWRNQEVVAVLGDAIWPEEAGGDGPVARGREDPRLISLTARYTAEIERVVRLYPDQWNWTHGRWRTRPEGEKII